MTPTPSDPSRWKCISLGAVPTQTSSSTWPLPALFQRRHGNLHGFASFDPDLTGFGLSLTYLFSDSIYCRLKLLVSSLEYHAKKRSAVLLVGKMVFLKWPQDLGHQRNSSWHQLLDSSSSLDVWQAMPQYKM